MKTDNNIFLKFLKKYQPAGFHQMNYF